MEMEPKGGGDGDTILFAKVFRKDGLHGNMGSHVFLCVLYFNEMAVFFFLLCGMWTSRSLAQDVRCSHFSIARTFVLDKFL